MENNNKILEELKEISPSLTRLENKSPYSVSLSYFNSLADSIVEKIKSGVRASYYFTQENPYSVPGDYFANLSATIVQKIRSDASKSEIYDEMEEISPLLNSISKKPVYTLPERYFEKAEWNKRVITGQKAKVVSLAAGKKALTYLAAAVIVGVLAVCIFLFTGKQAENFGANHTQAVSEVKKLSEQEIVDFLKTTSPTENIVSNNILNTKDNNIKSLVSKMSDKEIEEFLQENGEQDEM